MTEYEMKQVDILCGLIASPDQRIVHQLPDEYCPAGAFFPRSSHTTVPFYGIKRAAMSLIKAGYLSIDKARSDGRQIEYRASPKGRKWVMGFYPTRLKTHRQVSTENRRRLKKKANERIAT